MRVFLMLAAFCALVACGGSERGPIEADRLEAVAYRSDGPPRLTVFTMINVRTGSGGHTSIMVDGSQRLLFDPAGSFRGDFVTEYGDVLYGMSDPLVDAYISAHSRRTHYVVTQELPLTSAQAELLLRLVQDNGTVPGAFCANATTSILRQVPGFEAIDVTFYPVRFMEQIAGLPGVVTREYRENDEGDVKDAVGEL